MSSDREWLETFADRCGISYDDMIAAANDYIDNGEHLIEGGNYEAARDYLYTAGDVFWDAFENVTGRKVSPDDRGSFFCCTC